jgi:hypothetical protein
MKKKEESVMTEHLMETTFRTALWRQFGAAIDMLKNALLACPDSLWRERLWSDPEAPAYPTFWSLTHHTLFWLDLYLTGSLEAFAPPHPSPRMSLDQHVSFPNSPTPRRNSMPIWCSCVRSARPRCSRCQTSRRSARWLSPGGGGSR